MSDYERGSVDLGRSVLAMLDLIERGEWSLEQARRWTEMIVSGKATQEEIRGLLNLTGPV